MSLADGWTPPTADEEPPEHTEWPEYRGLTETSEDPTPEQINADLPESVMGPKP
jgi:hypothetical protein